MGSRVVSTFSRFGQLVCRLAERCAIVDHLRAQEMRRQVAIFPGRTRVLCHKTSACRSSATFVFDAPARAGRWQCRPAPYITVSRSGEICKPYKVKSSAVLTITVSCSVPNSARQAFGQFWPHRRRPQKLIGSYKTHFPSKRCGTQVGATIRNRRCTPNKRRY